MPWAFFKQDVDRNARNQAADLELKRMAAEQQGQKALEAARMQQAHDLAQQAAEADMVRQLRAQKERDAYLTEKTRGDIKTATLDRWLGDQAPFLRNDPVSQNLAGDVADRKIAEAGAARTLDDSNAYNRLLGAALSQEAVGRTGAQATVEKNVLDREMATNSAERAMGEAPYANELGQLQGAADVAKSRVNAEYTDKMARAAVESALAKEGSDMSQYNFTAENPMYGTHVSPYAGITYKVNANKPKTDAEAQAEEEDARRKRLTNDFMEEALNRTRGSRPATGTSVQAPTPPGQPSNQFGPAGSSIRPPNATVYGPNGPVQGSGQPAPTSPGAIRPNSGLSVPLAPVNGHSPLSLWFRSQQGTNIGR